MSDLALHSSLRDVEAVLRQLPHTPGAGVSSKLRLVSELARPDRLLDMLDGLLADESAMATVAQRSYRHVNHFDKIVLVDADAHRDHRLTLHLWTPPYSEQALCEELIHDHRFSFWSSILTGDLISQNFEVASSGRVYRKYRYATETDAGTLPVNHYEFCGNVMLNTHSITRHTPGESYHLAAERIHQVLLPTTRMTCTLVLRGPREHARANVYNTRYPATDVRTSNQALTVAELAQKLVALSNAVAEEERSRT